MSCEDGLCLVRWVMRWRDLFFFSLKKNKTQERFCSTPGFFTEKQKREAFLNLFLFPIGYQFA